MAARLADPHPALVEGHLETYVRTLERQPADPARLDRVLVWLDRVVDLAPPKDVVVVGCGPRPAVITLLRERGYRVAGVEPVASFVASANEYLGGDAVRQGSAEALPLDAASHDLVLCDNVLEHVDSPRAALGEMHRVLRPGGLAFITTTNRLRLDPRGDNGEFNVRFLNWFPALVRESYVFRHLHYDPDLANHSLRPAVHWFTYARLCALGRDSGFGEFFAPLDLMRAADPHLTGWKRALLKPLQRSPWLRALALTQLGSAVVMLKRRQT